MVLNFLQVAVNGGHVLEYQHRLELQRVDTLCISGQVKVQAVGVLPSAVSLSVVQEHRFSFLSSRGESDVLLLFSEFSFSWSQPEQPGLTHQCKNTEQWWRFWVKFNVWSSSERKQTETRWSGSTFMKETNWTWSFSHVEVHLLSFISFVFESLNVCCYISYFISLSGLHI